MTDEQRRPAAAISDLGDTGSGGRRRFSRWRLRCRPGWPLLVLLFAAATVSCSVQPPVEKPQPAEPAISPPPPLPTGQPAADETPADPPAVPEPAERVEPQTPAVAPAPPRTVRLPSGTAWVAAEYAELPGWQHDDQSAALVAFLRGCEALAAREAWRHACATARKVPVARTAAARAYFEAHFRPYRALDSEGGDEGLITGYYEPLLHGSRTQSERYRFPLYGVPDDLLVVDLAELHPELKGRRVRGRLEGRRIVPYYSRAQIENDKRPFDAPVLYWVDDPIDLFFLQVQGSGQIRLESGERVRIGYGDQNGHPYRSIGRFLIERGELAPGKASMQAIKDWAREHPDKLPEVLQHNASYVFFRELAPDLPGPIGALGVPVSAGRSLAVDPQHIPLGAPVYLATTWPNTRRPLQRLMMAQDTGSAIRGPIRGDYFWGYGEQAGRQAGRMRQSGRMWMLLPRGVSPDRLPGK